MKLIYEEVVDYSMSKKSSKYSLLDVEEFKDARSLLKESIRENYEDFHILGEGLFAYTIVDEKMYLISPLERLDFLYNKSNFYVDTSNYIFSIMNIANRWEDKKSIQLNNQSIVEINFSIYEIDLKKSPKLFVERMSFEELLLINLLKKYGLNKYGDIEELYSKIYNSWRIRRCNES